MTANPFHKALIGTMPYLPRALIWRFSRRYIAGTTLDDAYQTVRKLNEVGDEVQQVPYEITSDEHNNVRVSVKGKKHTPEEISAKIETLTRLQDALANLSRNCDAGTAACPMLEALMQDGFGADEAG